MSTIAREVLNQKEYLVVKLEEGEYLDEDCLAAVSNGQSEDRKVGIEGILPISYTQYEGRILRYDTNAYVPFAEYKKQIMRAEILCKVFLSILDTYKQAESYLLDPAYFLLKQEYIYMDKETGKAWLVIYPVYNEEGAAVENNGDFASLFRSMLRGIRLSEEDMAFYGSLSYELDSEESFNIVAFRKFLTEKGLRSPGVQERKGSFVSYEVKEAPCSVQEKAAGSVQAGGNAWAAGNVQEKENARIEDPFPPFSAPEPAAASGKSKGGGFLGGFFSGKSEKVKPEKVKKSKESEKAEKEELKKDAKQDKKHGGKVTGGIRLPDAEELPKGFQGESMASPSEDMGSQAERKNKRAKKDKTPGKTVSVWEPIAQTDDDPFVIPPTDDDYTGEILVVRRLSLKKPDTGEIISVGRFPFVIGREGSGLTIDASRTKVSRQHAVINETEDGFTIRDTSKLGTFLDGERIPRDEDILLKDGMKVLLKEVEYIVSIEERMG